MIKPLPASSTVPPQFGTGALTLQLGCLDRVEHAFAPIDVTAEEPATDELMQVSLDLIACRVQFQHEVGNRDLAAGRDDVEQAPLLLDLGEVSRFGLPLDQEVNPAADQRDDQKEREDEAEDGAGTLQPVFVESLKKPCPNADGEDQSRTQQEKSNHSSRRRHAFSQSSVPKRDAMERRRPLRDE